MIKHLYIRIEGLKKLYLSLVTPPVGDDIFDLTFDETFN
jgi:hypothetical protein